MKLVELLYLGLNKIQTNAFWKALEHARRLILQFLSQQEDNEGPQQEQ